MLRYAIRRILWAIPTLLATSLVLFLVTTLAPSGTATDDPFIDEARRARFLDTPRFLNTAPQDVRSRTAEAIAHVADGTDPRRRFARRLVRMGGAALPYILPSLETLAPEARGRVAAALAPLAERMGIARGDTQLTDPEHAVLFWSHFWDDRALDFTGTAVERAVDRLVNHGSEMREADLVALDTYALPQIMLAMTSTSDPAALQRLTRLAHHATGRGTAIAEGAAPGQVRRNLADWREWWFVHGDDYVPLTGASRVVAMVTETRYGKWLARAANGQLGVSVIDGEPIVDKLVAHAPVTLLMCGLAMLGSWLIAVPVGALSAWRRGKAFDVASTAVLFVLYATPTFAVAEVLRRATLGSTASAPKIVLAILSLMVGSVATLSRWQRSAMLDVVRQDFVRTARAKGLPAWRVAVVHALRNALGPTITLAGLHLPVVIGGAFVVEEIFQLPGLGFETLRAIEAHDAAWLMAVVLACAVAVTIGLVASDVAYGALDPRVRELLTRRTRLEGSLRA
jgi:ABC-type dipeptide/oligopeptide/nickel transport system permease component